MTPTAFALTAAALVLGTTLTLGQKPTPLVTQSPDKLVAVLQSTASQKEKAEACRELAVVGTKDAVPVLVGLLADEKLSHMARYALEAMPDPGVDTALRQALTQLRGRPLVGVIGSLGVRRDARAVEPLAGLLANDDPDVAQAAARALGSIATPEAGKALQRVLPKVPPGNQLAFCEGLFRCAETWLAKGQRKEAIAIYESLRRQPGLLHQVRSGALRGEIVARGAGDLALLREGLASKDYILFAAAVRASLELRGAEVTRTLTANLAGLPADNRIVVIKALGQRRDAAALPTLFATAKGGDKGPRLAAIHALAALGGSATVPVFVELLGEGDRDIAQTAQESLASLPGKEVDQVAMSKLASANSGDRLTGLDLVGRRRMTSALPALLQAAGDSDAQVRSGALKRLGELGGPAEVPKLLDLLLGAKENSDREAAEQAVTVVCGRAEKPESMAGQMLERLAQAQPAPKSALLRVLTSIGGPEALKAVRTATGDSNAEVKAAAIRALGSWKTTDAAPDLLALARDAADPADRAVALSSFLGLANNPDLPTDQRLAMCRQAVGVIQRAEEKKLLLAALGGIPSADALPLIAPWLDEAATKEEASAAVVAVADALLKGPTAAEAAPRLMEPLRKAAEVTGNTELARRAKAALARAESKTGK